MLITITLLSFQGRSFQDQGLVSKTTHGLW